MSKRPVNHVRRFCSPYAPALLTGGPARFAFDPESPIMSTQRPRSPLRRLMQGAAVTCMAAATLAGTATPASAQFFGRKKPTAPVAAAEPPPAPPIALSGSVLAAAGAYRAYMRKAATVSPGFKTGTDVEGALELAEASEPAQLSRGVVAYAALLALQDPAFVAGVRQYAKDPTQRMQVGSAILLNPAYASQMPGAASAAALVAATLNADGARLMVVGKSVKQSAYDVQKSAWSKIAIPDRDGRLARAKALSSNGMSTTPEEIEALRASIPTEAGPGRPIPEAVATSVSAAPPFAPAVQRGLAVAALAILGRAGDDNDPAVQAMLSDSGGGFCHSMAKLNLYQCLAVAKPFYEDVFCLGQHVLIDTAQCVQGGAGAETVAATPVTTASATTLAGAAASAALAH